MIELLPQFMILKIDSLLLLLLLLLTLEENLSTKNQSITSIEDLSNEIFYEIFDYFNGDEIVKTFSKLNSRFQQLLHSSSILIKTHFYLFYYEEMLNKDHKLEIFSNKSCSNFKILSISCSQNIIFLDVHRWEHFILHYYPQLEKFYFPYYDRIDNDNQYEIYSGRINQFSSTFWIERKWIFNIKIDNADIEYMICPYKKTWYDSIHHKNIEYSTSTTLILANFVTSSYVELITKVCLEEINGIDDFTFISAICPYMEYCEMKSLNNMKIELFSCIILKEINNRSFCFIRSLCFHAPAVDDQVIENLEKMTNYEQLLIQFTIKRTSDNIYLQWK
ncbi:unnamed protein product [Rotaria magnacalcarata]|uniref:F-box domain-containing protein n=1 Tax=Rotaria magnacalcarata TaxID=392030 RepID=A0A8S2P0W9_9BILA|nr:unnamed protein product [Rotaria magnacalcarata]CAF4027624.1 unnamed protein product [Rotaria magnacalcarata]